ncbi:serine/threonine-protein kinase PLK4 isoform X2 [Aplysia californica]|uniref:Serine/threonine-protein kinase PLK4 n=1 Tax=Aplysia californica TaxID=6500 RepID=A0ABM1A446_APLCA|nr:serine/threonine-protein kinase PLK4 isoform X2 [Aplysia californica]
MTTDNQINTEKDSKTLDDYQVLNLLGKGAFACVYRARSSRTGMEVAIKMIDKKMMKAAGMNARVKKEVEIHSRLKHPSVLELYNFFEDANYVYLVIEICHNGELQRYLRSRAEPLSEEEARRLMRQTVEGILYLHSHGILHRDLTLSNLLLTRDMNVKIADFGLATQLQGPDEKHFTMCGTPNYISPEIAMRSAHGLEADVWSLGCMLYTFLVGKPPFDTDAVKSTLNRVILAEYHLPDHLSAAAKDLIQALLRKNPKDRLPLREILIHPFMIMKTSKSKKVSQQMSEMSLDSGRGTISSNTTGSSGAGRGMRPMPAYPLRYAAQHAPQIAETEESRHSHDSGSESQAGNTWYSHSSASSAAERHPPSPPVRERDSETEEELRRTHIAMKDRERATAARRLDPRPEGHRREPPDGGSDTHKKLDSGNRDGMGVTKTKRSPDGERYKDRQIGQAFDPSKYEDKVGGTFQNSPSSSSWSVSGSMHSAPAGSLYEQHIQLLASAAPGNVVSSTERSCGGQPPPTLLPEAPRRPRPPAHNPGSVMVDQSEVDFSLNTTKKVLDFDSDSRVNSLYGSQAPQGGGGGGGGEQMYFDPADPDSRQTQELLYKVHNYLGQQCREGKKTTDSVPVQFSSPDAARTRVQLSEKEVQRCVLARPDPRQDSPRGSGANRYQGQGKTDGADCDSLTSPLNTERLRPIRQRTKNVVVHILEDGSVCVEFLKRKGQEDKVMEVLSISHDGSQVRVFQPEDGKGVVVVEQPPPQPDRCKMFDFSCLPQKYVKKYLYAARFVSLIQSKTPKVTMYTQRAKCMLMENQPCPDFMAEFYDGAKFSSGAKGVKIIEKDGTSLTLESAEVNQRLSGETRDILQYVQQCRQQCVQLEQVISSVQSASSRADQLFPVIVGRRPDRSCLERTGSSSGSSSRGHGVNDTQLSTIRPKVQMSTFDGTLTSTAADQTLDNTLLTTASTSSSSSSSSSASSSSGKKNASPSSRHASSTQPRSSYVVQQMFVPDIGWASQTAAGEVWVRFQDGTQLGVKSTATTVTYVNASGKVHKFHQSDYLPDVVKSKLSKLPLVLETLRTKSPHTHTAGSSTSPR